MSDIKYGTDPHELHRTEDGDTSVAAAYRVDNTKWERDVHLSIVDGGYNGRTMYDLLGVFGEHAKTSISPRFAPLRRKGLIFDSGLRRNNCTVWMDAEIEGFYWDVMASEDAVVAAAKRKAKAHAVVQLAELRVAARAYLISGGPMDRNRLKALLEVGE